MILQPPSILLEGAPGCGKTTAVATLAAAGIQTFVIMTEPGGVDSLIDAGEKLKCLDKMHWTTCMPATAGWDAMDEMTLKIGTLDFEGISKLKGIGKDQTRKAAIALLTCLKNFEDDRTMKSYGDFTSWDDSRALVIDSLSGLSLISWAMTVGYKPTGAPGEWNIAMNWIESLLMKINSDRKCYFVLTAHVEKEMDEISGVNRIMTSTLGRKLAPKIPRFFSEVVYAQRRPEVPQFRWSTIDLAADLKNRALPVGDKLLPDFRPIVDAHQRRKTAAATPQAPATTPPVAS